MFSDSEVVYFGVDREQAKRNAWNLLKELGREVILDKNENSVYVTLINGVRIRLMGMDNPDSARGMKIRFVVLDEYADMPEWAWKEIIRPALMDCRGGALFIGTPKGKTHFYDLFRDALVQAEGFHDWEAFNFTSQDNPTIQADELQTVIHEYGDSKAAYEQEIEAKFIAKGGKVFKEEHFIPLEDEPKGGSFYVSVDLAGFGKVEGKAKSEIAKLDDTAIAIVKVNHEGWWIKEIQTGKWDVRECALRIVKAAVDNDAVKVGIEKGALQRAVEPYLKEYMRQYCKYFRIEPVTHGNQAKWDRITWALQGRAEKRQLRYKPGPWFNKFLEQAMDFPDPRTKDDMIDALAYIDQICSVIAQLIDMPPGFTPIDPISGY